MRTNETWSFNDERSNLSPLELISLPQSMLIGFIKFEDIAIAATAKLGLTLMTQLDP